MATNTSQFGVSRREGHNASAFYARFTPPILSDDDTVCSLDAAQRNKLHCADARDMSHLPNNTVALCVFSPPYFSNKEYELEMGVGHVPATYLEYISMLRDVCAECYRVLEPGGRIAINVANLGRKPYRSLSADVTELLEGIGFLMRGEIIWQKSLGASGNCAWGSFAKATNPVLRDLTERIIVASKGRFDRAISPKKRETQGLPFESTVTKEEFMEYTLDLWHIPPASAKRVNHPAPYPIELPERLIKLYTFKGDVVLDPFMGSGSSAIAALRNQRAFVGYDMEPKYISLACDRIAAHAETDDFALPDNVAGTIVIP